MITMSFFYIYKKGISGIVLFEKIKASLGRNIQHLRIIRGIGIALYKNECRHEISLALQ